MPALFFRPASQLFGFHHPAAEPSQRAAVLLCYPGAHEYSLAHWAFRRLATGLAAQGLDVLRFEYTGMGDSAGDGDAGNLDVFVDDIVAAADQLLETAGVTKLSLVGMRLGASLAARASHRLPKVRTLVMWEPVVNGAAYLDELNRVDASIAMHLLHHPPLMQEGYQAELCGHLFSRDEWNQTAALDLLAEPTPQAIRTYLLSGSSNEQHRGLARRYGAELKRFEHRIIDEDADSSANLLGRNMIDGIVEIFGRKGT